MLHLVRSTIVEMFGMNIYIYIGERLPSEEVARARSDEIDGLKQYGVFENGIGGRVLEVDG